MHKAREPRADQIGRNDDPVESKSAVHHPEQRAGRECDQHVQRKIFGRLTGPASLRLRNIGALTTKARAPASDGGIYAAAS